ncbi:MAG: glycosyltransferase family 39 protein [Candidatus Peribacteraceae bacterium]
MSTTLPFLGILAILIFEGGLISRMIVRSQDWKLLLALSLPIAAFVNVLLVALCTITSISLTPWSLIGGHVLLTAVCAFFYRNISIPSSAPATNVLITKNRTALLLSTAVLTCIAVYAFIHGSLPTFQFDSLTNWTMRSQISFVDQRMAFDEAEVRGMAKPQYPYLFHALQITSNQGHTWNDGLANLILILLGLSSITALWLILRRLLSPSTTLITIALIFGTPLLATHMAQGYGDSVMLQYLFLAHALTLLWVMTKERRWLMLSGMCIAAGVWSKSEGLVFGLLPWLVTVGLISWNTRTLRSLRSPILLTLLLSLLWTIGASIAGLSLTPHHGSDATLALSIPAVKEAFIGLFSRGSFGIAWYSALSALVLFFASPKFRSHRAAPTLLMAGFTFVIILLIYTATPNSQFLLKGESYYRQMLLPLGLLILSLAVIFTTRPDDRNDE